MKLPQKLQQQLNRYLFTFFPLYKIFTSFIQSLKLNSLALSIFVMCADSYQFSCFFDLSHFAFNKILEQLNHDRLTRSRFSKVMLLHCSRYLILVVLSGQRFNCSRRTLCPYKFIFARTSLIHM